MNYIFISPNFPHTYWNFCDRLHRGGVNVLGIGDAPYDQLEDHLKAALTEYYRVGSLEDYDQVFRAAAFFSFKYGKIDWIESMNEYWLEQDARLRTDFNVTTGIRSDRIGFIKEKSLMKKLYLEAGIPTARQHVVSTREGIVTRITVYGGRAQVRVGDKVHKGQLLIAGHVTARDESMTYTTHAFGEVLAAVIYRAQVAAPSTVTAWAETGSEAPWAAIYFADWKLLERGCPFEDAELARDEKELTLTPWPLRVCYGTWREKVKTERALSPAEQKETALFEAERMALLQVPRQAKILMIDRHTVVKDGKLYGVCTVTTEENIGYTKEFT